MCYALKAKGFGLISLLHHTTIQYPREFHQELPLLVESVVRSLDPHVHMLREVSLRPATTLVHDLVMRYPQASFDQEEQRLAVGTKEGVIFIYDLNSATRWHVLEGHKGPIAALAFNNNGKILASYSVEDCQVKLWKTQQSLFGILGSDPHCYKTFHVSKPDRTLLFIESLFCRFNSINSLVCWDRARHTSYVVGRMPSSVASTYYSCTFTRLGAEWAGSNNMAMLNLCTIVI